MTQGSCVWLYAVAANDAGTVARAMTGVGGEPVRMVRTAGLTAFVGDVDQRDFGAAGWRRNREDLDWLDRAARAHHAVIEAIAERCPVVPMQLATVFASGHSVAETLRERATDLHRLLSRIRARSQWGVKAFTVEHDVRADARAVHAALFRLCVAARLYPPQSHPPRSHPPRSHPPRSPSLAGPRCRMVLNAAYLVADERAGEFAATIAGLTARHRSVRLVVAGPWPAYSFVGEGQAEGQR
jgi:hypothetical protein